MADDLDEFKARYGEEWAGIKELPAFRAAIQLLNIRKIDQIAGLTDEDIEKHGREILGALRGHLQLENDLITLEEQQTFKTPIEETEDYISPEEEAVAREAIAKLRRK